MNQSVRGIVAAQASSNTFILIDVLPHDAAIQWCRRKRLNVNHVTGALKIYDVQEVAAVASPSGVSAQRRDVGYFAGRADRDFLDVGIDALFLPSIRAVQGEADALSLAGKLPREQGQALQMLAAGYGVDDALTELLAALPGDKVSHEREEVVAAALGPASGSMFYVVEGAAALAEVLNQPLAHWRVFLHPAQRRLAYRPHYDGPARVLGGPGTGKTVVALHRTLFLARRLTDALAPESAGSRPRLLLTTFTKNLASALARQLKQLGGAEVDSMVDVLNIDAVAYRIVHMAEGRAPMVIKDQELRSLIGQETQTGGLALSERFVRHEWEQVILAQRITTREDYFRASRAGRGVRLDRGTRDRVWSVLTKVKEHLADANLRTHLQIAADAASWLAARPHEVHYVHVVIDEAQDLHPMQWRVLRHLVLPGPNDMFLVGDAHQRIYDRRISLAAVGVDIRGRGARLRLNYRTTYDILRWSLGLLRGIPYDDLDGSVDDLQGYRSALRGPPPTVVGYASTLEEQESLLQAIRHWTAAGVGLEEIGIAVRTGRERRALSQRIAQEGIAVIDPADVSGKTEAGVHVATMHGMKGLEYRCVAVVGMSEANMPHQSALTAESEDPLQHAYDVVRERSLLFVASTRPRDELRVTWTGSPSRFLVPML